MFKDDGPQTGSSNSRHYSCTIRRSNQKAKSGHPGMPMGCADFATTLWYKYMRHNPRNPKWLGRDRFILSAGHGSMLQYSLLHLFDYGLPMDELKQFRQWGSKTPGHPEYNHTAGCDVTTDRWVQVFASGVGMAIASKYFAAHTGLDKTDLADNKIFIISGDGCMMEGTTSEAGSLAGHLKLDNIICFYDDNSITIEGSTDLAFSEEVGARFTAYNWRVINVENANDIAQCDAALEEAMVSDGRPTLIIGKTRLVLVLRINKAKLLHTANLSAKKKSLPLKRTLECRKKHLPYCRKSKVSVQNALKNSLLTPLSGTKSSRRSSTKTRNQPSSFPVWSTVKFLIISSKNCSK